MTTAQAQLEVSDISPAQPGSSRNGVRAWVGKGAWGLLDMGLFAGGNFLTHVFLARWLPESVYGTFTTAFAIYLLFAVVHTSVMIEPMMVYGSQRYHRRLGSYLGDLVRMHARLCGAYALVLGVIAGVEILGGRTQLAGALGMFAVAQFALLLPWVLRDACYIKSDPRPAGLAGVVYLASVLTGLCVLRWLEVLSLPAAVGVLGCSAMLASAWLIWQLRIGGAILTRDARWKLARVRHWRFGRWSLLTNFIRYVPEHLPMILVPMVMGYAMGGALKALVNLITPFILVTWAMSNLLLPVLVRRTGSAEFEVFARRVSLLVVAGPLLCWPVLGVFGGSIVAFLYDGKFVDQAWVLWLLGGMPVIISLNCILFSVFRALDRPDLLLPSTLLAAAAVVVVGVPLLWMVGLWGMVVGMLIAQAIQGASLLLVYVRRLRAQAVGLPAKPRALCPAPHHDGVPCHDPLPVTPEPVP